MVQITAAVKKPVTYPYKIDYEVWNETHDK